MTSNRPGEFAPGQPQGNRTWTLHPSDGTPERDRPRLKGRRKMRGSRIAEPTEVEEVFGGRYDGAFKVETSAPCCGEDVTHLMEYDEFGPSHRVCEALCGGSYELARPRDGLLGLPFKWWDRAKPLDALTGAGNLGLATAGVDGVDGLLTVGV